MTTLTNKSKAGFGLPDGRFIAPGASVDDVSSEDMAHPVVKALLDDGRLAKGAAAARDAKADADKPALTKG